MGNNLCDLAKEQESGIACIRFTLVCSTDRRLTTDEVSMRSRFVSIGVVFALTVAGTASTAFGQDKPYDPADRNQKTVEIKSGQTIDLTVEFGTRDPAFERCFDVWDRDTGQHFVQANSVNQQAGTKTVNGVARWSWKAQKPARLILKGSFKSSQSEPSAVAPIAEKAITNSGGDVYYIYSTTVTKGQISSTESFLSSDSGGSLDAVSKKVELPVARVTWTIK